MKTLIALTALLVSAQAHAGAYTFLCSNAGASILIDRGSARIGSADAIQSAIDVKPVDYVSKSLSVFATDAKDAAISIEVVGKKTTLLQKKQTDECGNTGEKRLFSAKVVVTNVKTGEKLNEDVVLCEDSFYPGHCF